MRYLGSKRRFAKEILNVILKNRKPDQLYVEPFVGGFNMIDKVEGPRWANDKHRYLIALFREVQAGWTPPSGVTKDIYEDVRDFKELWPDHFVGFVGFGCSFSGMWFSSFANGGQRSDGSPRDYSDESSRALVKQAEKIQGVKITNLSFDEMMFKERCLIYCDPPYKNTAGYGFDFDSKHFWSWCREQSVKHDVFISEYTAPSDFRCVWGKEVKHCMVNTKIRNKRTIEKLWKWSP